jgi:hypothetical protein
MRQLRLGMPGVMEFRALGKKTLSAALTAPCKRGASAFRPHPGPKTVLTFARALRWLVSAFHKAEKYLRRELRAVTLGWSKALSILSAEKGRSIRLGAEVAFH